MLAALKRFLASPRAPLIAALLAVALTTPTLGGGFMGDDYTHRVMFLPEMRTISSSQGPWDMFRFLDHDRAQLARNMEQGTWPWWTAPDLRLAFFRPLTSLSHALDYRAWPGHPWLMHAENVALYGLLALLVGLFYRRLLGPPRPPRATLAAGIAAVLFAIDDAHAMVVTWIANRNAIVAATLGVAALLAHDRWRRDGWRPGAALGPLAFAAALLGGEAALGALAYLGAHALWLERSTRDRVRAFLPYAAVLVVWAIVYRALGYGASGGGFYLDPIGEPLAFLGALGERLPVLLAGQLAIPPADLWLLVPDAQRPLVVLVLLAVIALVALLLWITVPRDRTSGFLATGMVLSLVPVCATWPTDRLLLLSGLGAFGLLAQMLTAPREGLGRPARALVRVAAVGLVLVHAVVAPLFLPARSLQLKVLLHDVVEKARASLPPVDSVGGRTLVVVNMPDPLPTYQAIAARHVPGAPVPRASHLLSVAVEGSVRVVRTDERTLELTLGPGFFHEPFSYVYRSPKKPMRLGDRVPVHGMTVEIMEMTPDNARPLRVAFRFDRALEDPAHVWVTWRRGGYVPFTPPPVGGAVELESTSYLKAGESG